MGWPLDALTLRALRTSRRIDSQAWHRNLATGKVTPLSILDGSVTVDRTAQCRRTLAMTLQNKQSIFDMLDTPNGEITVRQSIVFATRTVNVPLGVFVVEQNSFGYSPDGDLTLTAPDRWRRVQRANFGDARSSMRNNTAWQEIRRLIEGAWPNAALPFPGWAQLDQSATTKVGTQYWDDGSRENASRGLERANSRQAFFDPEGRGVLRPVPKLTSTSPWVWSVNANEPDAVMTSADRERDWSQVHNAIRIKPGGSDVVFRTVEEKWLKTGDELSVDGPFGYVPHEIEMAEARNSAQARAAAKTLLNQHLGAAKTLTLAGISNPALDAEDVIQVKLPRVDRKTPRPVELHIIDRVVTSLKPGADQQIETRSTRPDDDEVIGP